jgi:hypothetical protein
MWSLLWPGSLTAAAKMNDRGYSLRSGALTRTREQGAPRQWHHKIPQTRDGYKAHGEGNWKHENEKFN